MSICLTPLVSTQSLERNWRTTQFTSIHFSGLFRYRDRGRHGEGPRLFQIRQRRVWVNLATILAEVICCSRSEAIIVNVCVFLCKIFDRPF